MTTLAKSSFHAPTAAAPRRSLLSRLVSLQKRAEERHAMRRLDAHLMRDLGLSQRDLESELKRFGWDAPAHWKR